MTAPMQPRMEARQLLTDLRADMTRYREYGGWYRSPGFWVGAVYRLGVFSDGVRPRAVRLPIVVAYKLVAFPIRIFRRVELPREAMIGPGLCLPNPCEILVPSSVRMGKDCTLHHGVVLGVGSVPGFPRLGDGVCLRSNARVVGGIRVGNNVEIEPNAVVTRDVEDDTVVQSPVARISRQRVGHRAQEPAETPSR